MEFLNPVALYGLFALPLLLVPYLIRRKPRRVVFSSLLLFREPASVPGPALGKAAFTAYFFLQLLLLTLLILALGEPVFYLRASNIAIVMDNSASMQTLETNKRASLWHRKKRASRSIDLAPPDRLIFILPHHGFNKWAAPLCNHGSAGVLAGLHPTIWGIRRSTTRRC